MQFRRCKYIIISAVPVGKDTSQAAMTAKNDNPADLSLAALLLVISCGLSMSVQAAGEANTIRREVDPVILSGAQLPDLLGVDIEGIRAFSFRQGRAVPIPFQVDQRNSGGDWVWDVVYCKKPYFDEEGFRVPPRRKACRQGRGTTDDQDPPGKALLDGNDELVLMAEDLGDRRTAAHDMAHADLLLEIEVADTVNDRRGWAYIAYFSESPPAMSSRHYMHYDTESKTVRSPVYQFNIADDHPALITNLRINDYPIVDRIKVKGEVVLSLPVPTEQIAFSEEDLHGYTEGYIEGPVRILKRNITHLSLSGGLVKTRDLTCDHFYYPRHAEIPVCLSIRFPVREIAMTLTTDYREPPFHRLYMGEAKDLMKDEGEEGAVRTSMHQLGSEWIALDSHEASLVSIMVLPEALEGYTRSQPCLCRGRLKPEQSGTTPGEHTEAGFLITTSAECPRGEYVVYGSYLVSAQPYHPGDEDAAMNLQHNKMTTRVLRVQLVQ